ncbi:PQQ-binding-like beta-propeller repeat protein [Chitinophaga pendula]|uniref:outer membrane protein assembly factor BamB family protein n=1 Tax=Chitinophaga TaxID=79328 RepID=UPI000BAEBD46|nr:MULTISPECIES: PQQ-binding-like beta-propeller repeat protein [Chitinophaga]ASZ12526.1 serine/threonine protein kinase [Chitinophaga sp. MD30]UCJ09870.1 PQQ-binding-like beta-propeller repeat protein [Chitinophaga pendula]
MKKCLAKPIIGATIICLLSFLPAVRAQQANKSFRFAWLTDTHVMDRSSNTVALQQSVEDINKIDDIQFTILTGDISDFGFGNDLRIAKAILDKLKKPYYIVPGNHDTKWSESGNTVFKEIFGHHNISFSHGNIRFIGFQTGPILHRGDGYISPPDLKWVTDEVKAAKLKGQVVIPFTHYPLNDGMSNWYKLTGLFKENGVPVVLVGHGHSNRKMNFDGLPGVMARTNPDSKGSRSHQEVGYTLVSLTPDSISFAESNPVLNKVTSWLQLSLQHHVYSKDKQVPDLSVNHNYPQVIIKWRINVPAGISAAATYDANRIYVGDRDGIMHAYAYDNGKQLWQFKTGKSIFSTPAVGEGKVITGSADGNIYCLNARTGKLIWQFKADKWVLGSPVIDKGIVYIGASDGKFRAIDLHTGKLRWEFEGIKGWIQTKPLIYQEKVYFGAWDNYFYALDQHNGRLLWKWSRSSKEYFPSAYYAPAACWPVAANGRIFITGPDMVLTALDANKGDTIWRIGKPRLNEAIGISGDGSKVFVKCTFDSTLLAYSTTANTPTVIWKTAASYGFDDNESAILEQDGIAIFPFRNGLAIAIEVASGKERWKHKLGDVMLNPATICQANSVLLSDVDGNLVLLTY